MDRDGVRCRARPGSSRWWPSPTARSSRSGSFEGDTESSPVAYVYDPAEDVWGGVQGLARFGFDLVALPDGRALAIGGNDGGELSGGTGAMTADVHRFEPGRGVWVPVSPMSTVRTDPQVAVLGDGRVLVAGGWIGSEFDGAEALTSTELYDPDTDTLVARERAASSPATAATPCRSPMDRS